MMTAATAMRTMMFCWLGSTQPIMPNSARIRSRMTHVFTADQPMAMVAWMAAGR